MLIRSLFLKSVLVLGIWTQSISPVWADQTSVLDALQRAQAAIDEAIYSLKADKSRKEPAIDMAPLTPKERAQRRVAEERSAAVSSLTSKEADKLRHAVQACWSVGFLSAEAKEVTVTIGFSMTPEGRHQRGSIRLVSATGGSGMAVRQAFDAARRAIIRCEGDGYGLSPENYEAWRHSEITFNPKHFRLR